MCTMNKSSSRKSALFNLESRRRREAEKLHKKCGFGMVEGLVKVDSEAVDD